MNSEDFEDLLRRQPLKGAPPGWRRDILAEAGKNVRSARNARSHRSTPGGAARRLWPSPLAWAALAAAWVAIFVLNRLAVPTPEELARANAGAAIAEANLQVLARFSELEITGASEQVRPPTAPKNGPPDQGLSEWPATTTARRT